MVKNTAAANRRTQVRILTPLRSASGQMIVLPTTVGVELTQSAVRPSHLQQ